MTGKNAQPTNQSKVPQLSGQPGDTVNPQEKKVPPMGKEILISKDAISSKGAPRVTEQRLAFQHGISNS